MAVPKKKTTRARRGKRRANQRVIKMSNLSECPQCHSPKLPHRACLNCGYYKGRQVIEVD